MSGLHNTKSKTLSALCALLACICAFMLAACSSSSTQQVSASITDDYQIKVEVPLSGAWSRIEAQCAQTPEMDNATLAYCNIEGDVAVAYFGSLEQGQTYYVRYIGCEGSGSTENKEYSESFGITVSTGQTATGSLLSRDSSANDGVPYALIVGAVVCVLLIVFALLLLVMKVYVSRTSHRIAAIKQLNEDYLPLIGMPTRLMTFPYNLTSKQQFDRFDAEGVILSKAVLEKERFDEMVMHYITAKANLRDYQTHVAQIEPTQFRHKLLANEEARQFAKLRYKRRDSFSLARVVWTYISPKGRNRYSDEAAYGDEMLAAVVSKAESREGEKAVYEAHKAQERAAMTPQMRYDVLARDGYRCVRCGATAEMGAVLHVDHIIPVSKGGKTEMDNLQTLCEDCNLGKGNRYCE